MLVLAKRTHIEVRKRERDILCLLENKQIQFLDSSKTHSTLAALHFPAQNINELRFPRRFPCFL